MKKGALGEGDAHEIALRSVTMQSIEPIAEVVEAVLAEVRAKFKEASEHAGIIESLRAFAAAVDWRVSFQA